MRIFRLGVTTLLASIALMGCTSEKPTAKDHVLKGQVQAMEKAKQVENVMQEHVDSMKQKIDDQQK
ncbi:MAG: hypothetical protein FD165_1840 [Gammaproteobacteria bacterium]|nr:MAG: hypothetical protein FD165_1840 [Gammaproteobacteria bacterium]TND04412.1 MAG: hypothetical protein FD120_1526 [Gammaproteobacteria bacterium]